jgi:hypothetical protein
MTNKNLMDRQQIRETVVNITDRLLSLDIHELLVFNQIVGRQKTPEIAQISAELSIQPKVVENSLGQLRRSNLLGNGTDFELTKDGEDAAVLAPLIIRLRFRNQIIKRLSFRNQED